MKKVNSIILTAICLATYSSLFSQITITGKVVDSETKKPVFEAIVKILDTAALEVKTNFGGYFQLTMDTSHHLLIFKDGFKTTEVKINSQKIQIALSKVIIGKHALSVLDSSTLYRYLNMNIRFPREARRKQAQGRVYISFDIDYNGAPQNIKVLQDIQDLFGEELVQTITRLPNLTPSKVNRSYVLPVTFKIEGREIKLNAVGIGVELPSDATLLDEIVLVAYGQFPMQD